jgi:transcription antitermination factor NusG
MSDGTNSGKQFTSGDSGIKSESIFAWFVIRVKPRHEKQVARLLEARGYETLLPLARSSRIWGGRSSQADIPIFDGYVFCQFDAQQRLPILIVPGVAYIVGTSDGPLPIISSEIQALNIMMHSKLPIVPWPIYAQGTPVSVVGGPLRGATGLVISNVGECRLIVSIELLQRSVSVEVDPRWIQQSREIESLQYPVRKCPQRETNLTLRRRNVM